MKREKAMNIRSPRSFVFASVVLACSVASPSGAQQAVSLGNTVSCERCRLSFEPIAVVYDLDGRAGMSPPAPQSMLRTSTGNLFLTTTNPFAPLYFDEHGTFVRTLGTPGQGPGEYNMPMWLATGPGDTVWTFDAALQRRTAWSPDGSFLITRPLPVSLPHAAVLEDGDLVMTGPVMAGVHVGRPMHRVSAAGELLNSFGDVVPFDRAGHLPGWIRRVLAPSKDGGLWASFRTEYRIERYGSDGRVRRTLERPASWFPARDPAKPTSLAVDGPQPTITSIVEDEEGLVRVLISLPAAQWQQGIGERQLQPGFEAAGVYYTPVLDYRKVFNFMVEIIDPVSNVVVVSHRGDGYAIGWLDKHHLATYREDEVGIPVIEVFRVDVVRP
jgi:hypothetical protein